MGDDSRQVTGMCIGWTGKRCDPCGGGKVMQMISNHFLCKDLVKIIKLIANHV